MTYPLPPTERPPAYPSNPVSQVKTVPFFVSTTKCTYPTATTSARVTSRDFSGSIPGPSSRPFEKKPLPSNPSTTLGVAANSKSPRKRCVNLRTSCSVFKSSELPSNPAPQRFSPHTSTSPKLSTITVVYRPAATKVACLLVFVVTECVSRLTFFAVPSRHAQPPKHASPFFFTVSSSEPSEQAQLFPLSHPHVFLTSGSPNRASRPSCP
mmetsp:Transcript_6572/g.22105  ORF Transcript_6572/g.22105 Transcript_6572/m.22105 type:complete len:210 (-) Transcript_6572:196-825(-)